MTPSAAAGRQRRADTPLRRARTCYDHLAGRLGVAVTDAMTGKGLLDQDSGFALTGAGADWLTALGIDVADLRKRKRPVARVCLDMLRSRKSRREAPIIEAATVAGDDDAARELEIAVDETARILELRRGRVTLRADFAYETVELET